MVDIQANWTKLRFYMILVYIIGEQNFTTLMTIRTSPNNNIKILNITYYIYLNSEDPDHIAHKVQSGLALHCIIAYISILLSMNNRV